MRTYHRSDLKSLKSHALGLLLIIIFVIITLSGCIGQENERVLRIGNDFEPNYLDPALFTRSAEHAIISNIYSYLIGFEPGTLNMVGDLAKTVPSVENGLISRDQLISAMHTQILDELKGVKSRLVGEILRDEGYITDTQIDELVECL